jgi:hypothetical protein
MYKLSTIIKEVKGLKTYANLEIIGYFNRDLFVDSKKVGSNVDTTTGSLKLFKNYLFFDINDSNLVYDLENNQLFDFKGFRCYPNSLEGNQIICVYETNYSNNKFSWKTGLLSFNEQKIIREFNCLKDKSIAFYLSENFVIVYNNSNTLSSLSLITGEYEWEVDLGAYGEIRNILGIVEDELYVWLGSTTLVAISIQNGEVQWYINTYETHKVGFVAGVHLLAAERKVVLFYDTNYVEIDLQTQTSKLLLKNTFGKDWAFSANTVVGNYIYFTGRNYATGELSVGVFNRQKLEVEWYYAAPEWQGSVPDDYEGNAVVLAIPPQVTDDRLYVLENGTGTLYIFEKEQA